MEEERNLTEAPAEITAEPVNKTEKKTVKRPLWQRILALLGAAFFIGLWIYWIGIILS